MISPGSRQQSALAREKLLARIDPASPWQEIVPVTAAESLVRTAPGLAVPLKWPADWRARSVIAESVQIVLRFRDGTDRASVDRIALYPRARATIEARTRP